MVVPAVCLVSTVCVKHHQVGMPAASRVAVSMVDFDYVFCRQGQPIDSTRVAMGCPSHQIVVHQTVHPVEGAFRHTGRVVLRPALNEWVERRLWYPSILAYALPDFTLCVVSPPALQGRRGS